MASLKLILGLIPSTSKIELAEKALTSEYEKLKIYSESKELIRYIELNKLVNSSDFIQKRKEIESLRYKHSGEYTSEKEFFSLQKAKDIVLYFKTLNGNDLKKFKKLEGSEKINNFEALEIFINSSAFREKEKMRPITFRDSDEYRKYVEYKALNKTSEIRKFLKSKKRKKPEEIVITKNILRYEELGIFLKSHEFLAKKKLKSKIFKKSEEYQKFIEYTALNKQREIRKYLKSKKRKKPEEIVITKNILRYEELDVFVKSPEFHEKEKMKPITFKDTEEYKKLLEYKKIKGSPEIKEFYKFKSSNEYSNYLNTDGSKRLSRLNELEKYIASAEFKEKKNYLLDKKRFEKTQMFKDLQQFDELKKSEDIVWYFKVKDSNKFNLLKQRVLTFSDEFDSDKLDTNKWLTNYYWGEKLLKDRYSVESDLQAYTEKDNFELRNSVLKINTKPQKMNGKVWSSAQGFKPKEFNYTSGLINSGNSFRQKYGVFSAKIKLGNPNAKNVFWMLADKITPHIDICRTSKGKVWFDYFPLKGNASKTSIGSRYSNGFFIYTLEWTSDNLIWKINDTEVFRQSSAVPQEPMYVTLAGGLDNPINGTTSMEIDWVRVYKVK
jgi:beta-glucanase (GH16 family)